VNSEEKNFISYWGKKRVEGEKKNFLEEVGGI
jgi:hypothetical protein